MLLERERSNLEAMWKNRENTVKRNITEAIRSKCREEWNTAQLMREAEMEIKEEK